MNSALFLLLNAASTLFMTGLVWFVQIVHYPLFGYVGVEGFVGYANQHTRRTSWVVGPPMLLELTTSVWLVVQPPPMLPPAALWSGLILTGVLWLSTLLLQIPRHNTLGSGFNASVHRALVATNWIRTIAWSLRTVLVLWMLATLLR